MWKPALVLVVFICGCQTAEERAAEQARFYDGLKQDYKSAKAWQDATGH